MGISGSPSRTVSRQNQPDSAESHGTGASVEEESRDQVEVVDSKTSPVPVVQVEMAQRPPSLDPSSRALGDTLKEEASYPQVSDCSGRIIGSSPASYFKSDGPKVIRCFQVASDSALSVMLTLFLLGLCVISRLPHLLTPLQHHFKSAMWEVNSVFSCTSYINGHPVAAEV